VPERDRLVAEHALATRSASRSSFEPGKTTTPQRISDLLGHLDAEVLDHAVGEQALAHLADAVGRGSRAVRQRELDVLPDPHVRHLREAERVQRCCTAFPADRGCPASG
jgi:hypothetical protein